MTPPSRFGQRDKKIKSQPLLGRGQRVTEPVEAPRARRLRHPRLLGDKANGSPGNRDPMVRACQPATSADFRGNGGSVGNAGSILAIVPIGG